METESEYGFVVKAESDESETREALCSHEHLQKFVMEHLFNLEKKSDPNDPSLYFGSDLENIEQAA